MWDPVTRQDITTLGNPLNGTSGITSVAFSPDGTTLATGYDDGAVALWDMAANRPIGGPFPRPGTIFPGAFSPDGKTLATVNLDDGAVQRWRPATHEPVSAPRTVSSAGIDRAAFSPDGNTIAFSTGDDCEVRLQDLHGHSPPVTVASFASDCCVPPAFRLLVAFNPVGKILAFSDDTGNVQLWELATHQRIATLTSPASSSWKEYQIGSYPVDSVAFSPDGSTLATGYYDGTTGLWRVATHRKITTLTAPAASSDPVSPVAFSPDGSTLATATGSTLELWDVTTGQQAGTAITSQSAQVSSPLYSMAFSPDGNTLATGYRDGTIRLWDIATQQQITAFTTGANGITSMAFSPDGQTLAASNARNVIRLWRVGYLVNARQYLCASTAQSLTSAQWARYAPGQAYQKTCP